MIVGIYQGKTDLGLKYYSRIKDAPISYLLIKVRIITEKQLIMFSDLIWQNCKDTDRSIGAYIVFYQGETIYHFTHVPGPVSQYSSENEYNALYTIVMALSLQNSDIGNGKERLG